MTEQSVNPSVLTSADVAREARIRGLSDKCEAWYDLGHKREASAAFEAMRQEIAGRSPEQISYMEAVRGLA